MARVPIVKREQVPGAISRGFRRDHRRKRRSHRLRPRVITINSPEMARRRNHLTSYLRYETTFPRESRNWQLSQPLERWIAPMSGTRMRRPPAGLG